MLIFPKVRKGAFRLYSSPETRCGVAGMRFTALLFTGFPILFRIFVPVSAGRYDFFC